MKNYNLGVLKALADETRLKILSDLKYKSRCACELPPMVDRTQPAVSQHLKILLKENLVEVRKKGAMRIYTLSKKGFKTLDEISTW